MEWICTYDHMSGTMRTDREYSLMPYLSYSLVAFYPLFQERGAQKAERPKADWEVRIWIRWRILVNGLTCTL